MLFADILDKKREILSTEFDKLFDLAVKNQTHDNDLLLTRLNGSYDEELLKHDNLDQKFSPYIIGMRSEGWSEKTHYEFIQNYIDANTIQTPYNEYLTIIRNTDENKEEVDAYINTEDISVQLEMLIYLKIWESDAFIKRFYQWTKLVNKEDFDWHFKLSESSRDINTTGTRQDVIRNKIRERIKSPLPQLFDAFKSAYLTQIRNSIAHSNYAIHQRIIYLNNRIESDKSSQLFSQTFDDWIDRFHTTIVIYKEYFRLINKINDYYSDLAQRNYNTLDIRVSIKETIERTEYRPVAYRPFFAAWGWKTSDESE